MGNFWKKFNKHLGKGEGKPFFVLAPMADVTDIAFRQMFVKYGKPDVLYTEFVSCDGLCSVGRKILLNDLRFAENERPIVAQFFGAKPENFYQSAKMAAKLGFDGFDINMGCPDKAIVKQGAGAALMKNPKLAREIIRASKEGAGEMPVSVKTRIGFNKIETENWISEIVAEKPAAIIVHGRTKKEMSDVDAHWDEIAKAAKLAKEAGIVIVGNGDVKSREEGIEKAEKYGVDGIMVGRGAFGNPWFFNSDAEISIRQRLEAMIEHTKLFEDIMNGVKNFNVMRKHYKAYASGFNGAKELRIKLMETENSQQVYNIVEEFLKNHND